jgi:hypothetical protein
METTKWIRCLIVVLVLAGCEERPQTLQDLVLSELSGEERDHMEILMMGEPETDRDELAIALVRYRQVQDNSDVVDSLFLYDSPEKRHIDQLHAELGELLTSATPGGGAPFDERGIAPHVDALAFAPDGTFRGDRQALREHALSMGFAADAVHSEVDRNRPFKYMLCGVPTLPIVGFVLLGLRALFTRRRPKTHAPTPGVAGA